MKFIAIIILILSFLLFNCSGSRDSRLVQEFSYQKKLEVSIDKIWVLDYKELPVRMQFKVHNESSNENILKAIILGFDGEITQELYKEFCSGVIINEKHKLPPQSRYAYQVKDKNKRYLLKRIMKDSKLQVKLKSKDKKNPFTWKGVPNVIKVY